MMNAANGAAFFSGYSQPATLYRGEVGGEVEVLKRAPAFFDTSGLSVAQHFADSDDGTRTVNTPNIMNAQ